MKLSAILAPVTLAAALALSACSAAPAPYVPATISAPSVAPAAAPAVRCEEDMPCWNCHTMGNLACGVKTPDTAREAWATFNTYKFNPKVTAHAVYVGTFDREPVELPMTEFTLQSVAHPTQWHIFRES